MKKLLIFPILLILSTSALAGYISLETKLSSEIVSNTILVDVNVVNKGDESAYNVQGEVRVGGEKVPLKKIGELGINATYQVKHPIRLRFDFPGVYPLTLLMHYTDANQYPFSALTCQTFSYKREGVPGSIFGKMDSVRFWKDGKIKLTLQNLDDKAQRITAYLAAPRELTVKGGAFTFDLPGKSKKEIQFSVENFSALNGSSYQVYAITEFEKNKMHYTQITPGMINVVESKSFFGIAHKNWIFILILLIVIFIFFQLKKNAQK